LPRALKAGRWLALLAGLAGCGRDGPPPICDGVTGLAVTRVAAHPGGGDEVTARLRFTSGVPIAEADLVKCLHVEGNKPAAIVKRPLSAAFTLLLVDPGRNAAAVESARGLVQAILKKRPPGESIAVFRWGPAVTQIAPFDDDHRLLLDRLLVGLVPTDVVLPAGDALAAAAAALDGVGGLAVDASKTIVLVNARSAALTAFGVALPRAGAHLVATLGGDQDPQLAALPSGLRFPISTQMAPALVVSALSDRLDAYQRHAHYAVGLCGQAGQPLRLMFQEGEAASVSLPPALPEDGAATCDAEAIAAGRRVFPGRLDLQFTPDQRAGAASAFLDRAHRPPFDLTVRIGEGPPVRAVARYRGDAAYDCARRSYALELDGEAPRFLFPRAAGRRFELVAMCLDRMYLRTFTALSLLSAEGLYPIPFDLVEVAVDGISQGPYLVLEEATDGLRAHTSALTAVVRRLAGPAGGTVPEVRWAAGNAADAEASYGGILGAAMNLSGRPLETALGDRLDLQRYLTWVALMNLLGSGRYRDQILFYAAQTTGLDGSAADYHQTMGWDEDDLFAGCRAGGQAIYDPRGLVGCAEAELDRRIFTDSLLYTRYAEVLSSVIERTPPERFAAYARATAVRLGPFLERAEVRAGLVELRALDPRAVDDAAVARGLLEDELALLSGQFSAQRAVLDERLEGVRGGR
jgi:hypothetical protein